LCLDFQNSIFEIVDSKLQTALYEYIHGHANTMTYIIYCLARENATHQLLDPFLISFGSSRMPPVQTVELQQHRLSGVRADINDSTFLNTADISAATFEELVIRVTHFLRACNQLHRNGMPRETTDTKGIQAPGAALTNETENAANVVRKNRTSEPRAIDEARCLKDLLFLIGDFL
jgi:hypothetical protein